MCGDETPAGRHRHASMTYGVDGASRGGRTDDDARARQDVAAARKTPELRIHRRTGATAISRRFLVFVHVMFSSIEGCRSKHQDVSATVEGDARFSDVGRGSIARSWRDGAGVDGGHWPHAKRQVVGTRRRPPR